MGSDFESFGAIIGMTLAAGLLPVFEAVKLTADECGCDG